MRPRKKYGVAAGAAVLAILVAAPAIAGAGHGSDRGGQPPPGAKVVKVSDFKLGGQPPAGSEVVRKSDFRLGRQPVNRHPVKSTGFKAGAQLRHSRHDKGVKGLKQTKDRGKKNLPAQKEH